MLTRSTIITLGALALLTTGCASGGDCELQPTTDAATPGCFPNDPCCEADSQLSPAGAPCGTGELRDWCPEAPYTTVLLPTCSGTSALCDGPVIEVPRSQGQCLVGYHCRLDDDNRCRWVGRDYNPGPQP